MAKAGKVLFNITRRLKTDGNLIMKEYLSNSIIAKEKKIRQFIAFFVSSSLRGGYFCRKDSKAQRKYFMPHHGWLCLNRHGDLMRLECG